MTNSGKTCLVVDDSRVVRRVARRILETQGFTVREAEDGQQALLACREAMPDSVLLDWNMPVMNGLEMLERMRAQGYDQVKVLMVTTEAENDFIIRALNAGADEYLMKPFDAEALNDKLYMLGLVEV